jgi:transposase
LRCAWEQRDGEGLLGRPARAGLPACKRGRLSRAKIAVAFQVSESTVYRWLQAWRAERRRPAKPHAGGSVPRQDVAALAALGAIVAEVNDLTLAEYAATLAKLGLRRKKSLRARERERADVVQARAAWREGLAEIDPKRLVLLDESGLDTRMARSHSRAAKGQMAVGKLPWGGRRWLTVLACSPARASRRRPAPWCSCQSSSRSCCRRCGAGRMQPW